MAALRRRRNYCEFWRCGTGASFAAFAAAVSALSFVASGARRRNASSRYAASYTVSETTIATQRRPSRISAAISPFVASMHGLARMRADTSAAFCRIGLSVATGRPCRVMVTTSPLSINSDRRAFASNTPIDFTVLVYHSDQNGASSPRAEIVLVRSVAFCETSG